MAIVMAVNGVVLFVAPAWFALTQCEFLANGFRSKMFWEMLPFTGSSNVQKIVQVLEETPGCLSTFVVLCLTSTGHEVTNVWETNGIE